MKRLFQQQILEYEISLEHVSEYLNIHVTYSWAVFHRR